MSNRDIYIQSICTYGIIPVLVLLKYHEDNENYDAAIEIRQIFVELNKLTDSFIIPARLADGAFVRKMIDESILTHDQVALAGSKLQVQLDKLSLCK